MSNLPRQQNFRSESYSERNSSEMVIITIKTILNEKVGYQFFQETVAQPKWDRRHHGFPQNEIAQIFADVLYQVSAVRK